MTPCRFLVGGRLLVLSLVWVGVGGPAFAQTSATAVGFEAWRETVLRPAALQSGITPKTFDNAVPFLTFLPRVIELDQQQPEDTRTLNAYSRSALSPANVRRGRQVLNDERVTLQGVSQNEGVPPSVIVALWSVESRYGKQIGSFPVLSSLSTLAYEGRRAAFFQNELLEALQILQEEGLNPAALRGSWAGAMGQCQFMPSTYRRFAVDGDGDGRRDIWNNRADVLASIAHYLAAEGWRRGQTWGLEVRVPPGGVPDSDRDPRSVQAQRVWELLGVRTLQGGALPVTLPQASLLESGDSSGRVFLVGDNFQALRHWNRSSRFALTVGLLADALGGVR